MSWASKSICSKQRGTLGTGRTPHRIRNPLKRRNKSFSPREYLNYNSPKRLLETLKDDTKGIKSEITMTEFKQNRNLSDENDSTKNNLSTIIEIKSNENHRLDKSSFVLLDTTHEKEMCSNSVSSEKDSKSKKSVSNNLLSVNHEINLSASRQSLYLHRALVDEELNYPISNRSSLGTRKSFELKKDRRSPVPERRSTFN